MKLAEPKVLLNIKAGKAKLVRGEWSEVISITLLPARLEFYRSLRDRLNGRYAAIYQPEVAAIERAIKAAKDAGAI
jgi:hypothetical protein